jgi:hypothetical protein
MMYTDLRPGIEVSEMSERFKITAGISLPYGSYK